MRLIDADAAIAKIDHLIETGDNETVNALLYLFTTFLNNKDDCPTIALDDSEVRRGHWITKDSKTGKCSFCGWWQHTKMYYLPDDISIFTKCYRFCTSCGAEMSIEKEMLPDGD